MGPGEEDAVGVTSGSGAGVGGGPHLVGRKGWEGMPGLWVILLSILRPAV